MTNLDLITSAMRKAGMVGEGDTPSPEQGETGLQLLNQLLAAWGENSMRFPSWFQQTSLSATLPLPDWAERAVTLAMTIEVCGEYGLPVSDVVATTAGNAYDALLVKRLNQQLRPVDLNLPAGEGDWLTEPLY